MRLKAREEREGAGQKSTTPRTITAAVALLDHAVPRLKRYREGEL